LSESIAAGRLAGLVASLNTQGVSVITYPVAISLIAPHLREDHNFDFEVTGPPGVYTILQSADLASWSTLGLATNTLGSINFTDVTANLSSQKFYRAIPQDPPQFR
jgi:hypothetical protein